MYFIMFFDKTYRFILRLQNTDSGGSGSNPEDIVNKQDEISGQRKEVNVKDYGEASSIGQTLKD
jgi:hypothetical protein